uniref:Ran-specific GTPase-activating protein-like n=1 Tax=Phallusia mammillata TaxID=59560 RepID=A0A6F9DR03_9ASCI|nr:ran-specific GTPase-activating protein-like [Phallusia mammillata]
MAAVETVEVHDPHYEPIISLPEQVTPTLEEDEDILFKMRAKLFRWARESDPPEWKERGTGDVKLLKHRENSKIRLVMRRDKTYKTCANHYLDTSMELVPNCGSERAWVWTTFADFAEGEAREELLAIRFLNSTNANEFKEKFCECQQMLKDQKAKESEIKTPTNNEEKSSKESEESSSTEKK